MMRLRKQRMNLSLFSSVLIIESVKFVISLYTFWRIAVVSDKFNFLQLLLVLTLVDYKVELYISEFRTTLCNSSRANFLTRVNIAVPSLVYKLRGLLLLLFLCSTWVSGIILICRCFNNNCIEISFGFFMSNSI